MRELLKNARDVRLNSSRGAIEATIGRLPVAGFLRFDSDMIDDYVDRMFAQSLPHLRNDSSGTAAFARELEHIFQQVIQADYPELRATEFIPLNTEVPAGSLTYTYRLWTRTGRAKVIHNYAEDLPNAGVNAMEWPAPIITTGASYSFSVVDMQRVALTGTPLESLLADAARWAVEFLGEQIACVGSAQDQVVGLVNAPGIVATAQVSIGTWLAQIAAIGLATAGAPATAVAAAQGIISDVNAMKAKVRVQTRGLEAITNILLPTDLYAALEAVPRSPAFTDDTLLDYIRKICKVEVDFWPQLDTAGAGGTGRVMAYKKDPLVARLIRAQPFTQLAPQPVGLAWVVPCLAQEGGVNAIKPLAITYMDHLDG